LSDEVNISENASRPRRLWVLWLLFFFQFAAIGVYFTYLNVYYREAGLSGTQIGLINMTTALIGVGSAVLWGYISDRTGKNRLLIAGGAMGALITAQFIPYVSAFPAFMVLASISALLGSSAATLVDSTTLALLGENREDYGRYRLGGTIGYILTTLTAGFLFDYTGLRMMFPAYAVIMTGFALVALLLPDVAVKAGKKAQGEFGLMIRRPSWILFTVCIFLCWIATNASIMFLGVVLQSMGANQSLIGIAVTVGAIIEIPFMAYSGRMLRRFGPVRLLMVAMLLMVARYSLLGMMRVPEWAIAINMLNGPAFVMFWNSAVTYANKMAPKGMAGTAQGFLNSTMALAGVVSSLLTGVLFDRIGPNGLFIVMASFCLVGLVLFAAGNLRKTVEPPVETRPAV
jgi:MFS transporter, PPP family, 3-phenylpropionic acid transporter